MSKQYKKTFLNAAILLLAILLSVILITVPRLKDNALNSAMPINRAYADKDGHTVTAVDIVDLAELGVITEVNHTPRKYLASDSYYDYEIGEATTLDELVPAEFGTLRFCVLSLDPMREDFDAAVKKLKRFQRTLDTDTISVTVRLNFLCSAATVFQGTSYLDTVGTMRDYDISEYLDAYSSPNTALKDGGEIKPVTLELPFVLKRDNIDPERLQSASYFTVHYQTDKGQTRIMDNPLIGTKQGVECAVNSQKNTLLALLSVSALFIFAFAVLILLKRQTPFIGHLIALAAVFLLALSAYLPYGAFSPLVLPQTLKAIAVGLLSFSAILCMRPSQKFKTPYYAVLSLSAINVVVLSVLAGLGVTGYALYALATSSLFAAAAVCFGVFDFIKNKNGLRLSVPFLSVFVAIAAYALPAAPLFTMAPFLWVASLIVLCVFLLIAVEFIVTERRNRFLTDNLQAEVGAQTATLKSVIDDKNRLLAFIAHDLRKPAVSVSDALLEINDDTLDENNRQIFREVSTKVDSIKASFFEVSAHMKESFVEESFTSFNLAAFLSSVLESLKTDCTAAGIVLSAAISKRLTVYAKRRALSSVVDNLILNAVEHANCTRIAVSASRSAGFVTLTVTDDGKGLDSAADIFSPYVGTGGHEDNLGLGLYIVKSQVEAMGGTIACTSSPQGTAFTVKLISK